MQFAEKSDILIIEIRGKRGMIMDKLYDNMKFIRLLFRSVPAVNATAPVLLTYVDVTYVLSGEISYRFNGNPVTAKAGDAIVFPRGCIRQRLCGTAPAYYVSFNVKVPDDFDLGVSGLVENALCPNTVYLLENAKKDSLSIDLQKENKCLSIFLYLCCQLKEIANDSGNVHVKLIKQYINDHLCEHITLGEISNQIHIVEQYICAVFKKYTGMTVFEYINSERVDLAKRLIATNEFTLIKISEMCGFFDYNYFSRIFKRVVGITPLNYRRSALSHHIKLPEEREDGT